jgi:nitroreductase
MSPRPPDHDTLGAAVALAVRAPSVHNTQPWRWRIGESTVHLYGDPSLQLIAADPEQRDLVISCGAALHHLRIALAALGWSTIVHRLPNPAEPDHLAAVELVGHRPTPRDVELAAAIERRRTDRRRYSSWPVPPGHFTLIIERAAELGVVARQVLEAQRPQLAQAVAVAAGSHARDPEYQFELAAWSGRHATADGVPARNTPRPHYDDEIPARNFLTPLLADDATSPDGAQLLVLGTSSDDRMSWLRAGEAVSSVLLTATNIGMATCLLTEPLEIAALRRTVRMSVLGDWAFPQAIVRLGWAATTAEPLPATPRRAVEDVLDPFDE